MLSILRQSASLAPVGLGAVRGFTAAAVAYKKADPSAPAVPKVSRKRDSPLIGVAPGSDVPETIGSRKKRDPSLPVAPKGSASPYALFVKSWFPENKAKHANSEGKIDLPTVATALSTAWGALTMDEKQTYTDKAKELKKAFDAEYKTWYNGLDATTLKAIEKDTGKKVAHPGGRKGKKLADSQRPGNPGVPLTAFFEYMKEFRAAEGKDLSVSECGKKAGQQWRDMGDEQKQIESGVGLIIQKYRDLALSNKAKYVEWQKSL